MRFIFPVLIFMCYAVSGNAQGKGMEINNKMGLGHIRVESSKVYMVPPAGYEQVIGSIGFKDSRSDNSIIVREAVGSYKSLLESFLKENLKINGLKMLGQEKLTLNNEEATFFTLMQKVGPKTFGKYLLLFGDDEYNVMISAVFPEGSAEADAIKQAMLSVAYKEERVDAPMPVGFSIDFSGSGLKFARRISDAVMYTADGSSSNKSLTKNSFFAGSGKEAPADRAAFSLERMQKQTKSQLTITENKPVQIAGLPGYEISATTTAEGGNRMLYQVLLFRENMYYILLGSATENHSERLQTFRKIAATVKLD